MGRQTVNSVTGINIQIYKPGSENLSTTSQMSMHLLPRPWKYNPFSIKQYQYTTCVQQSQHLQALALVKNVHV